MADLAEDFRLPVPCPNCGSHRMRVSEIHNPEDKVFCASCNTFVCFYRDAEKILEKGPGSESEALIEEAFNRNKS